MSLKRLTDTPHSDASAEAAEPALIRVYRETVRPLHRFVALRAGGSRELVEDVLQEVYLRAIEAWQSGHPPREPLPWLKTLARNLLINYYRKHRARLVDPSVLSEATSPDRPAGTPAAVALIHRGLAGLPDRHARLLEAFHLDRRSVREIATALDLSERAVEGRLHRARKALRKRLEPLVRHDGEES
jgi:RNA polymerase sigma-70 factor (ECF subfamily)